MSLIKQPKEDTSRRESPSRFASPREDENSPSVPVSPSGSSSTQDGPPHGEDDGAEESENLWFSFLAAAEAAALRLRGKS